VMNAVDHYPAEGKLERLPRHLQALEDLGLEPAELDLRAYGSQEALSSALSSFGGVWVVGGNTFVLRRAMHDSGFDQAVKPLLQVGNFVYGGYSAGVCVLAPNLRGIHLADEPDAVQTELGKEIIWEGLDLVPYMIVPHYRSDHPESPLMEDVVEYLLDAGIPYKTLADGEAIVLNGETDD
jgi:dipeptidase E